MGQKASTDYEKFEKKGGLLGTITSFLGVRDVFDSSKQSASSLISFPQTVMTYLKWVAIGGAVLVGIFIIVFIWRFSRGNAPDVIGAAGKIAAMTPQGRLLSAAASRI